MKKISVIYWSGTGNTEQMAKAVAEGAKSNETEVSLITVGKAGIEDVSGSYSIAFGCPSMGAEELDSDEMEPFIAAVEKETIKGKNIILFGSYDWGDGQWMREWKERMKTAGAVVIKTLIVQNTPDEDAILKCKELGRDLSV